MSKFTVYPNRFILSVIGENRNSVTSRIEKAIPDMLIRNAGLWHQTYSVQNQNEFLHDIHVRSNNTDLIMHGHVVLEGTNPSLEQRSKLTILQEILEESHDDFSAIPNRINNGSYVGIVVDNNKRTAYVFGSFLNPIPVYYSEIENCLVVSTDLSILASLSDNHTIDSGEGILEYYALGTNLTTNTGIKGVHCLPKGAGLLYARGKIKSDFYHILPDEDDKCNFWDAVDEFSVLWDKTISAVQATGARYGLGLTGGIDSRVILAGMRDRKTPWLYTGSNSDHPDWLVAKYITERLGLRNHVLEDYRESDKLSGYAEYCCLPDNPLHANDCYYMDKLRFRIDHGLSFELMGLTEFLGGVYHYRDRRSLLDTIRMSTPVRKHRFDCQTGDIRLLITLSLRNKVFDSDIRDIFGNKDLMNDTFQSIVSMLTPQLGNVKDEESFLERFRHIHKMSNLLVWSALANRRYLESFSPSMNMELTDFACRIPLRHRDSRKILFAYLRKFHPELAMFPMTGYIFTPQDPWILFKMLSPQIKAMNHLGIKVPYKQWYIRKSNFKDIDSMPEVYEFQRRICQQSPMITETPFNEILNRHPNDHTRLMRCFNIALLTHKLRMNEQQFRDFLMTEMDHVIHSSGNPKRRSI